METETIEPKPAVETTTTAPAKPKSMTMTQQQFEEAIQKQAEKAAAKIVEKMMADFKPPVQNIIVQPHADVLEEEGATVPPMYVPKDKTFRVHKMNDGSLELKKRSQKKNFNALERDAVILAIDDQFKILTREVAGQEKPKPPTKLFVNARFRELFEHQNRWSDASDIMVVSDEQASAEDFLAIKGSSARFKFAK